LHLDLGANQSEWLLTGLGVLIRLVVLGGFGKHFDVVQN